MTHDCGQSIEAVVIASGISAVAGGIAGIAQTKYDRAGELEAL